MEIIMTIVAFLVLTGIVVTIHEGGHFFTALACGMKVMEFSIGFGPKIFQRQLGKDKILFTLRAIPLGGYVKPMDQSTVTPQEWEAMPEHERKRSFANAPRWKKALMVAGGPASNFVLAFIVFILAFSFVGNKGLPAVIAEVSPGSVFEKSGIKAGQEISHIDGEQVHFSTEAYSLIANGAIAGKTLELKTSDNHLYKVDLSGLDLRLLSDDLGKLIGFYFKGLRGSLEIKRVIAGGAGEAAGLQKGDILQFINAQPLNDMSKALRVIRQNPEKELEITVLRDGKPVEIKATPEKNINSGVPTGKLGIELTVDLEQQASQYKTVYYALGDSIAQSFNKVVSSTSISVISIWKIITGEISTKAISGPLSMADYSGQSFKIGLYSYMTMIAAISIAIGVFNLLPVPMLDGGYLLQYTIEAVRRRNFSNKEFLVSQYIGLAVICSIFTLALVNDISKYLSFLG